MQQPTDTTPLPDDEQTCRFFAAGNCRFGTTCRYSHKDSGAPKAPLHEDSAPSSSICRFFAQGNCKFGTECRFLHSKTAVRTDKGITFKVSDAQCTGYPSPINYDTFMSASKIITENKGRILMQTRPENKPVVRGFGSHNGFVGAALIAYSYHLHLILRPDDVWLAITTSLARFIDKHAEEVRHIFVDHEGKQELEATGAGCIMSANYDELLDQISAAMDKKTKQGIVPWITNNFSTTTKKERFVSKLVLMGAMKNYFSYKFNLCCNLPAVTLEGTVEDWKDIRHRVDAMKAWSPDLGKWADVLGFVLDEFVVAAEGNPNTEFWNRIATIQGGGSGPRYIQGWILAFIGFDEKGKYFLPSLNDIQDTNDYGVLDTNDIPTATVDVPVTIDDNGREYKTIFYAGFHSASLDEDNKTIRPSADWALIDVTPS